MASDGRQPRRLVVSITDDAGRPLAAGGLARWLASVAPAAARGSVTVALVGDWRMMALNRQYRGIEAATDVLSFPDGKTGCWATS
jgi:ssRNA-specific RNase YbeY (16S rRNA maturation enzyme)